MVSLPSKKRGFAGKGFWEILPLGLGSTLSLLTLAVTGTHLNARKLQEMAAWTDLDQMPVETLARTKDLFQKRSQHQLQRMLTFVRQLRPKEPYHSEHASTVTR
jgi:hypothetical protein